MNEMELTPQQMVACIEAREPFTATALDGSFQLAIHDYFPYVCTAIHNGGLIRDSLLDLLNLDKLARWSHESPKTGLLIQSFPIHLVVSDSFIEYNLDRPLDKAICSELGSDPCWKRPLEDDEIAQSQAKHLAFYEVFNALIHALESDFGACLILDVRAFNWRSHPEGKDLPLFRLMGDGKSKKKCDKYLNHFKTSLESMTLESMAVTVETGSYPEASLLPGYVVSHFKKSVILGLSIKKIFCNETRADVFPEVVHHLRIKLKEAILRTAMYFADQATRLKVKNQHAMLRSQVGDVVELIDSEIFKLHKRLEMLPFINPTNIEAERRRFFARRHPKIPNFLYQPLPYDPDKVKRRLYQLPLEKIQDPNLYNLYRDIIENTANRLDLLRSRQTRNFVYYSLIFHGEPGDTDISNARYLLHCADQDQDETFFDDQTAAGIMKEMILSYGFKGRVELVQNLASRAAVINATRVCKIRKGEKFSMSEIHALSNHEIGVHMVTNMNASTQPLSFLRLGLPRYTESQEGLALLAELLSGNLSMKRLKQLAHRVLSVKLMLDGADFIEVYNVLTNTYGLEANQAFYMATRVFRSGGFTKDYVYLRGLHRLYKFYTDGGDLTTLLLGKTSMEYMTILNELRQRNILKTPKYVTHVFREPQPLDPILTFILNGLK